MKIKLPTIKQSGMSQYDFDTAVADLIEKGLVEVDEINGEFFYYLNKMGSMIRDYLNSDLKFLN